ncbi:MAG: aldolase [Bacteroidales bacterium]|nr:aldolase [Bacteroidales bacterium]
MSKFNLMILASTPEDALSAQNAGVDRVFFDLEYIGKAERQRNRDTVKYHNDIEQIPALREVVTSSSLLVRTNPIHAYTATEVEKAIRYGADYLMLPMTMDRNDVETYVKLVNGRAKVIIMIETAASMTRLDEILEVPGIDELFIGLNDLHISMGLNFLFEPLAGGLVDFIAKKCKAKGVPFGFGGIARIGDGILPADMILGEHVRVGSSSVILSRTFKGGDSPQAIDFKAEVDKVRNCFDELQTWSADQLDENRLKVKQIVNRIVFPV